MELNSVKENGKLTVSVKGRVDTTTAPEFEKYVFDALEGVEELVIDLAEMSYSSSAGLRVLLKLQKTMNKQGKMIVKNVQSDVMEIFSITGFEDILTIE